MADFQVGKGNGIKNDLSWLDFSTFDNLIHSLALQKYSDQEMAQMFTQAMSDEQPYDMDSEFFGREDVIAVVLALKDALNNAGSMTLPAAFKKFVGETFSPYGIYNPETQTEG